MRETTETKTHTISYASLASRVGDMVLNNYIHERLRDEPGFGLFNGVDEWVDCSEDGDGHAEDCDGGCNVSPVDIYQEFIITDEGARLLKDHTDEIVYYDVELNLYLWAVTHFGTCWSGVYCNLKKPL